jgi:hypothetical protein
MHQQRDDNNYEKLWDKVTTLANQLDIDKPK